MKYIELNKNIFGKNQMPLLEQIGNVFFVFVVAVFIIFLAFSNTYSAIEVEGESMLPNFHHEDVVYYVKGEINYGDVVIVKTSDGTKIIKRVVGLPGDNIMFTQDDNGNYRLCRNGIAIKEDYILSVAGNQNSFSSFNTHVLPLGKTSIAVGVNELFVLGDNRGISKDSTYHGCFNTEDVIGRVDYSVSKDDVPFLSLFQQMFLPFI